MGTKTVPDNNQPGWNYASGQMAMPMPGGAPMMPPYPVPVPQVQPSAPASDEKQ